MKSKDLARAIGIAEANLSRFKPGSVKGVKLNTLNKICQVLDCKPGDLLDFEPDSSTVSGLRRNGYKPLVDII